MEYALLQLDQAFPMLTFNTLERYSVVEVREVLARLVDEGVSVYDLRSILEALLEIRGSIEAGSPEHTLLLPPGAHPLLANPGASVTDQRVAYVRAALKWQLTSAHTNGQSGLSSCMLAPEIEDRIARMPVEPVAGEEREQMIAAVAEAVAAVDPMGYRTVIVTREDVRLRVRELIRREFPHVTVLAYQEVAPGVAIHGMARIG